ncbi:Calpain family cysteine protease, putative [Leishmania lindenbergi]|uniref:Calpain family cysteine protease n=1 Tax=Leishmania lindenbergi TaxID=651832 RepID=A0AAW2ZXK2_9TRYP
MPFASSAEASMWMQNAVRLDTDQKYVEAEECYTKAILLFRQVLTDPNMADTERYELMNYMSDVAKRIQRLRTLNSTARETCDVAYGSVRSPEPNVSPANSRGSHVPSNQTNIQALPHGFGAAATALGARNPRGKDISSTPAGIDNSLEMLDTIRLSQTDPFQASGSSRPTMSPVSGRRTLSVSSNSPFPPALPGKPPGGNGDVPDGGKPGDSSAAPPACTTPTLPACSQRLFGAAAHFAPRTSEIVYKAIEIAIQLSRQGELKRTVDVLQHAYTRGSHERNNPGNFKEIAETLKLMRQKYYAKHPPRFLQDNPILPSEMELLRKSGITSTILLPLWDDVQEGYGAENIFMPCEGVWEDAFTPKLCQKQINSGAVLMHFSGYQQRGLDYTIVREADPLHIQQSVVGDCSLVCSLMICASYQKRFPKAKIISNVIYPQDPDGNPILNPKGKYCVKMLINGITRIVTVDDRLPVRPQSRRFLCTSSTDPSELWVSIMEKAFVKVCGGSYNFPGSVSYADLYKLSGWLPDSTAFDKPEFDREFQWLRLYQNFKAGALLFTVSTPEEMPTANQALGLAAGHAYAVLDMQEVDKERVMLLRNPWGKQEWNGKYGRRDTSETSVAVRAAFGLKRETEDMGVFCIAYDDVVRCFDNCSLSWNPYMLFRTPEGRPARPVRIACHGTFDYTLSTALSPQLHIGVVDAPKRTRMHLILSRHITDVSEFGRQYQKDDATTPYLALKVYDVTDYPSVAQHLGGKCSLEMCYCRRLASNSDFKHSIEPLNDVIYRASSARTFSFDCPAGSSNLVVVVSRTASKARQPFNFTITLHTELEQMRLPRLQGNYDSGAECNNSLLANANADAGNPHAGVYMHMIPTSSLKFTTRLSGNWVKGKTCGGRTDATTYVFNPQYRLHLDQPSHVSLRLAVTECETPCSIQMIKPMSSNKYEEISSGGTTNGKLVDFDGRVGNGAKAGELVLESTRYAFGGAVLDSALPFCVCYDRYRSLGKLQWRETKKVLVNVTGPNRKPESFIVYDVTDTDTVAVLLLNAIKKGYAASPRGAHFAVNGKQIMLEASIASLFQLASCLGDASLASGGDGATTAKSVTVVLALDGKAVSIESASSSPATKLKEVMSDIVADVLKCSSQFSSYVPRLTHLYRQVNSMLTEASDADVRAYILELAAYLGDYVKRCASAVRSVQTPQTLLPLLPAGNYTVIPSLWEKGMPGNFELTVETTQPHKMSAIPKEGHNMQETLLRGALRPVAVWLSSSLMQPKTVLSRTDPFFESSRVQVLCPARSVFMSRLFVLMDVVDAEAKGQPAKAPATNLSLFRVHNTSSMELVCASDEYSHGGVSTPPVELEAKTPYLLVVSAKESATDKFLLRIYTSGTCTAHLVN